MGRRSLLGVSPHPHPPGCPPGASALCSRAAHPTARCWSRCSSGPTPPASSSSTRPPRSVGGHGEGRRGWHRPPDPGPSRPVGPVAAGAAGAARKHHPHPRHGAERAAAALRGARRAAGGRAGRAVSRRRGRSLKSGAFWRWRLALLSFNVRFFLHLTFSAFRAGRARRMGSVLKLWLNRRIGGFFVAFEGGFK